MALPDVEKAAFRTQARRQRLAISMARRDAASRAACEYLIGSDLWSAISSIALYAAYGSEINPGLLEQQAIEDGKKVYYPRVLGDALEFAESTLVQLKVGYASILEPITPAVTLSSIDLIIVPGLSFGPKGQRLGSGRGFYDRTLNDNVLCVGMAYSEQINTAVPTMPHDVRMKGILTDEGFILSPPTLKLPTPSDEEQDED